MLPSEQSGRIGVAQAIDRPFVPMGVVFEPCCLKKGCEADPVLYWQAILVAEYEVVRFSLVAPLLEPIEVALGVRLADDETLSCLTLNRECYPFPVLISVDADIPPFEVSGFALSHAGVGHDEHIFPQECSISSYSGVLGLLGPASHE